VTAPENAAVALWAAQEFGKGFALAIEGMAMAKPELAVEAITAAPADLTAPLFEWKQDFAGLSGEAFVIVTEASVMATGQHVMSAAGIEDASPEELSSTFRESMGQAFSLLGRAITTRLAREVTPALGSEGPAPAGVLWHRIQLKWSEQPISVFLAFQEELIQAFEPPKPLAQSAAAGVGTSAPAQVTAQAPPIAANPMGDSKTFDLLLDVELPISVSFGHAQIPLKDVLKLTTGSIVELSRAVVEPVDVVVNNCVIAKGEVVVIEGNFGVRIQHVISRAERLHSIQ
jgi:flagellar motor switch protein FliN/FliY